MVLGSQGNLNPQLLVLTLKLIKVLGEIRCFLIFSAGHNIASCTEDRSQFVSIERLRMGKEFLCTPLLAGSFRFFREGLKGKAYIFVRFLISHKCCCIFCSQHQGS